ncbi:hypothetical protein RJT34_04135 [Clitoria ternatea]|uniref:Uncharacterized protein n=1 Tax=Clitoria ternatea TaxID=43366 RepID=A0AAN9Q352_CLITE
MSEWKEREIKSRKGKGDIYTYHGKENKRRVIAARVGEWEEERVIVGEKREFERGHHYRSKMGRVFIRVVRKRRGERWSSKETGLGKWRNLRVDIDPSCCSR